MMLLLLLGFWVVLLRPSIQMYVGCAPCSSVICQSNKNCSGHLLASDPCGCCPHCARQRGDLCGGRYWERGYCDIGLTCALIEGIDQASPPDTGVCKVVPGKRGTRWAEDPLCPFVNFGWRVMTGICDLEAVQTCFDKELVKKNDRSIRYLFESEWECRSRHDGFYLDLEREMFGGRVSLTPPKIEDGEKSVPPCTAWGCELLGNLHRCECLQTACSSKTHRLSESECEDLLEKAFAERCSNVSCPEVLPPFCPADSFLTNPYTPPGHCCPLPTVKCTCNLEKCPLAPPGCQLSKRGEGYPGSCCDQYQCGGRDRERERVIDEYTREKKTWMIELEEKNGKGEAIQV